MTNSKTTVSPIVYARIAGVAYLIIIVAGLVGEMFIRNRIVVSGDPVATARNIRESSLLWRIGIAGDLIMHVCDLIVTVVYFYLFRRVNKNLALLAVFFGLIQTAVLVANKLNLVLPLFLLGHAEYLKVFNSAQLDVLAYFSVRAHGYGFAIGLIFFGFECLIDGYLIIKSGFLPKLLGMLLQIAGFSYLFNSFLLILFPEWANAIFPFILIPPFIGELSLCLWLIVKGVNMVEWNNLVSSDS